MYPLIVKYDIFTFMSRLASSCKLDDVANLMMKSRPSVLIAIEAGEDIAVFRKRRSFAQAFQTRCACYEKAEIFVSALLEPRDIVSSKGTAMMRDRFLSSEM